MLIHQLLRIVSAAPDSIGPDNKFNNKNYKLNEPFELWKYYSIFSIADDCKLTDKLSSKHPSYIRIYKHSTVAQTRQERAKDGGTVY